MPPEAQRTLLEQHLFPLLDAVLPEKRESVVTVASQLKTSLVGKPVLDYEAKQAEINSLLRELEIDSKCSCLKKERSKRDQLLEEMISSLTDWMNDIWSVVYEYHVEFALAHNCLMLAAETIETMIKTNPG